MINLQNSKKLNELGIKSKTWDYYRFPDGTVEPRLTKDHIYMIRKGVEYICPCFDLDSILTKEALIKVFKENQTDKGWCWENKELVDRNPAFWADCKCHHTTALDNWQWYGNKLTEIYSEQGYSGVNKYLETYLTGDINR